MRKWFRLISIALLLAGGIVLCAIRWQAWFGTPEEPQWTGDTLHYVFPNLTGEADQTSNSPKDDLTILVLGDIHNRLSRAEYDTLAARVPDAQIVLQAGDWMERGQNYYRQLLLREWTASTRNVSRVASRRLGKRPSRIPTTDRKVCPEPATGWTSLMRASS